LPTRKESLTFHNNNYNNNDETMNFGNNSDYMSSSSTKQVQQVIQQQDDLEAVKQRQEQMHQLETDIVDLNSVFKDLAVLVQDQGEVIDSIETNINTTELTIIDSNKQLVQATKHQVCTFFVDDNLKFSYSIYYFNYKQSHRRERRSLYYLE
jgi:vacuolar-type H+-ATPase subunit I/STV1